MKMASEKNIYSRKSNIGGFKANVSRSENSPFYFEKGAVRFFKSKIADVYANQNNTKFVARESIRDPQGREHYKILVYDYKKNKLFPSKIYDRKSEMNEDYKLVKSGEKSEEELRN